MNIELLEDGSVITGLYLITALYAGLLRNNIPMPIYELFKNNLFRLVFLSLLLIVRFDKNPHVAILIVFVFIYTIYMINQTEVNENIANIEELRNLE